MAPSATTIITPKFPPLSRFRSCPRYSGVSYSWIHRFFYYIHTWILIPLSLWYMRFYGISSQPGIFFLPFGLMLKSGSRVREAEGIAMNIARSVGVPAPVYLSFGRIPGRTPSILMTCLPGISLDQIDDGDVDWENVTEDLSRFLVQMRSVLSPYRKVVCGPSGGLIRGSFIPGSLMAACKNEAAFQQAIRDSCYRQGGGDLQCRSKAEELFAMAEHAIVFTHGNLNKRNVLVGPDSRITGIVDWESAAWMPEYWEAGMLVSNHRWRRTIQQGIFKDAYLRECACCAAMIPMLSDTARK